MREALGRPLTEALAALPAQEQPRVTLTAAPVRFGQARQEGTLRVIQCRDGEWIAARFLDGAPREPEKEDE